MAEVYGTDHITLPRDGQIYTSDKFGAAPSWFTAMADAEWLPIADGVGERIIDVADPNHTTTEYVNPTGNGDQLGLPDIMRSWTGGALDTDRNELVTVAHGGHDGYGGNEYYACQLLREDPRWYRVADGSQPVYIAGANLTVPGADYTDGRPRTVHGYGRQCYGNNRIWMTFQDAVLTSASGQFNGVFTFNRNLAGLPSAPGQPSYNGDIGGLGAWERWNDQNNGVWQFGADVYDPNRNVVYSWAGEYNTGRMEIYDADNPNSRTFVELTQSNIGMLPRYSMAVMCPDLDIAVVRSPQTGNGWTIGVYSDLDNINSVLPTVLTPDNSAGMPAVTTGTGAGAAYDPMTQSIFYYETSIMGNQLVQLKIPTVGGNYNPVGTWEYVLQTPSNPGILIDYQRRTVGDWKGTYGKFQIVADMGDGRSAAFFFGLVDGPAYCWKIPQGI